MTLPLAGFAQGNKSFNLITDNIESILPPLEALIDSAILHNPIIKFKDLEVDVSRYKLKSDQKQWVRNVGIQADGRYGTFDNFSTNTAEGQNPALLASRSNQLNYGVGAYIKIPFYDIINRKNQIHQDKAVIEQAQKFSQVQRNDLRQSVIKLYNDLIVKHRVLKIKWKYAETSKITMQIVEKDYTNGAVSITEYARISEISARTEADLESSKMDFHTAFMILEEVVGIKFKLSNDLE